MLFFKSAARALWSLVLFLLVGGLGLYSHELQATKVIVPNASTPLIDEAQILSPSSTHYLNQILLDVYKTTQIQVGVLMVKSLGGISIEEYSMKVAESWKLGQSKTDKGVILIVAPLDRQVRIEVGYGLEGELTDLLSGRIIRYAMIPYFKQGNWDAGLVSGVQEILKIVAPESIQSSSKPSYKNKKSSSGSGIFLVFVLFLIFFRLFGGRGGGGGGSGSALANAATLAYLLGSGRRHHGGFGGGGSSWGSWGGGGGGFGGGGASGSW